MYYIAGTNKNCEDPEPAIDRTRNHAATLNAARHGFAAPCVKGKQRCYNSASSDRLCKALVVHCKKMKLTEAEVVLIGEGPGI
ncbi:MAG: hypothetical protein UHP11_07345 [Anaerovoracaceae bacterium]|nr:hypothetical protein [Anaerovoracaceae bacterium]